MKRKIMHSSGAFGFVCLIMLLVLGISTTGCTGSMRKAQSEGGLEQIAQQYWTKRLVEKDYRFTEGLEDMAEPMSFEAYVKKVKPKKDFGVLSVRTMKVKMGKNGKASVWMSLKCHNPAVSQAFDMTLPDKWILKDGQWRHELERKKKSP